MPPLIPPTPTEIGERTGVKVGASFFKELEELTEDIKRGYPPAKWMAELLHMVKSGEITQQTAKHLQDTWLEGRKGAYKKLCELLNTAES